MLSTTAQYALRALSCLAAHPRGEAVLGRELAELTGIPSSYLSKILLTLNRAGLVEATRGTGGGYRLARTAETISLVEIVDPIDGVGRLRGCIMGLEDCSDQEPCSMHTWWQRVRDDFLRMLQETTLAEVSGCRSREEVET